MNDSRVAIKVQPLTELKRRLTATPRTNESKEAVIVRCLKDHTRTRTKPGTTADPGADIVKSGSARDGCQSLSEAAESPGVRTKQRVCCCASRGTSSTRPGYICGGRVRRTQPPAASARAQETQRGGAGGRWGQAEARLLALRGTPGVRSSRAGACRTRRARGRRAAHTESGVSAGVTRHLLAPQTQAVRRDAAAQRAQPTRTAGPITNT